MSAGDLGPVLFAYDGSDLAKLAIEEAGRQLQPGRDALVLTLWRPFGVGFIPPPGVEFDAAAPEEVRRAAEKTAAHGASMAQAAGFRAGIFLGSVAGAVAAHSWRTVLIAHQRA